MGFQDNALHIALRKGDKFVRFKMVLTTDAKTGGEVALYARGAGKLGKDNPAVDRGKLQGIASHAEARAKLDAEVKELLASGHVPELLREHLEPWPLAMMVASGGSLATPPIGEEDAPIFCAWRNPAVTISDLEDRALRRLADAVGLTTIAKKSGDTVLHAAIRCGSISLAEACLAAGVSPTIKNAKGESARDALESLAKTDPHRAALTKLFSNAATPASDAKPTDRDLCVAAKQADLRGVERCLAAGISPNAVDGLSAVLYAARCEEPGKTAVLSALLAAGGTITFDVVSAALGGPAAISIPAADMLVTAGARPSEDEALEHLRNTEIEGATRRAFVKALREANAFSADIPLATAVTMSDLDAVTQALARGENPNAMLGSSTYSILHYAACDGGLDQRSDPQKAERHFAVTIPAQRAIVEALLAAGAATDVPRVRFADGEQDQETAYLPTLYLYGGARADQAATKMLKVGVPADRKEELEQIVSAIGKARKAKPKAGAATPAAVD